jgi:hypothetical protein
MNSVIQKLNKAWNLADQLADELRVQAASLRGVAKMYPELTGLEVMASLLDSSQARAQNMADLIGGEK